MINNLRDLVEKYEQYREEYIHTSSAYNETQTRRDFIDPLLKILGWDVDNSEGLSLHLREVVLETSIEFEDGQETGQLSKKPDYGLRVVGRPKLFVEAKKPSVRIEQNNKPAFQLRRYGWTARLSVSVLTNFEHLIIYDCRYPPKPDDDVRISRLHIYRYDTYIQKFKEIHDQLSRESVYSGQFDKIFNVERKIKGTEPFDEYFLRQIENWRKLLALDLSHHNQSLNEDELNFLVQRLINRIIFLRICEDREIEKYKRLQEIKSYNELKKLFLEADHVYNSGLFNFIEDQLSLDIEVGSDVLVHIFKELYYPKSPYAFSVVDAAVLGEIYELFLGQQVILTNGRRLQIKKKPEAVESGGVVPTPLFIVDNIIERTVKSACDGKSPDELATFRVADIACGSGTFILAAFEYFLNYHHKWYLEHGAEKYRDRLYEDSKNQWHLTLYEKQRILLNNIYGVDIDIEAVEVARFSILLKTLEDETLSTVKDHLNRHNMKALPDLSNHIQCGNSLIDFGSYLEYDPDGFDDEVLLKKINPLDWEDAFPKIFEEGGFDIIVGNPPYIRIQNMVKYIPNEVSFYQSDKCHLKTSKSGNFDKYFLFIERALALLKNTGTLGYLVPHKFTKIKSGKVLRNVIAEGRHLERFVDFGVQQVFSPRSTTYTCILILSKSELNHFVVLHVRNLSAWKYERKCLTEKYNADEISDEPWIFIPPNVKQLIKRLEQENPTTLHSVANIFVGVQTSADKVYFLKPEKMTQRFIHFTDKNGKSRKIEKEIVRPSLLDVQLECFGKSIANTFILFPYKIEGDRAVLYTPEEMEQKFPMCWKYLKDYEDELQDRSIQNGTPETWYRFGRSQSLTKFDGREKLIWPILSLKPCYTYDDNNILFTGGGNGPYYALRPKDNTSLSIYYLLALLSHPVFEVVIRERSSKFRGGYYSHGKQFIQNLPIKVINIHNEEENDLYNRIISITLKLINTTEKMKIDKTPQAKPRYSRIYNQMRKKLNEKVEKLYCISKEDVKVIEELTYEQREVEE